MKYECIKSFSIPICDEDWFETGKDMLTESGSLWELDDRINYIGGEHHLGNEETGEWIEISSESLKLYFKPLEESEAK